MTIKLHRIIEKTYTYISQEQKNKIINKEGSDELSKALIFLENFNDVLYKYTNNNWSAPEIHYFTNSEDRECTLVWHNNIIRIEFCFGLDNTDCWNIVHQPNKDNLETTAYGYFKTYTSWDIIADFMISHMIMMNRLDGVSNV